MSPDMCMKGRNAFASLIRTHDFSQHLELIVIDKSHLIKQWEKFRSIYLELGGLRVLVNLNCPTMLATATATPDVVSDMCSVMHLNLEQTYYVNLGNDRHNITHSICRIKSPNDYAPLLDCLKNIGPSEKLPKTLIFCNDRETARVVSDWLGNQLDPVHRDEIDFYYLTRHKYTKSVKVMPAFCQGRILILSSTEATGMVLIPSALPADDLQI